MHLDPFIVAPLDQTKAYVRGAATLSGGIVALIREALHALSIEGLK